MSITVERFIETVSDYKIGLVAGKDGNGNIIEWFHVVDNALAMSHVNENELVFSSGENMDDEDTLVRFIEALIERKSSGLVLIQGPYVKQVSEVVKKLCNNHSFPLMVLTHSVNMSAITKLLSIQLLESEKINRQLFSAMKNAISFPQKLEGYVPTFVQSGFKKNEPYAVSIVKMKHPELITSSESQWLVKSMEAQLVTAGDRSFVLTMDDIYVFVFSNYSEEDIREIMLKMMMLLRMKEYQFYVGCSINHSGIEQLTNAYVQARKVVDLSERKGWSNLFVHYRELGAYQLLLAIDNKNTLKQYYDAKLGVLEKHDRNNGSDYLEFLTVYLTSNCNINDTADKLFIHRNTVVYKIKKINELLDCDLNELEVRVKLYLAIMLKNII